MAAVHSRAVRSAGAILAGIASSTPEKGVRAAAELGFTAAYPSGHELIADPDIDVVHICTPNSSHAKFALAAIEAGKHVVCEKPVALTVEESERVVSAARKAGLVGTVPFVYRFHPMVREARARVADGGVGRITSLRASYLQDWLLDPSADNWRVDAQTGGSSRAFADIGSHLIDLLEFVTNDPVTSLVASAITVHPERLGRAVTTEDVVSVVVRTEAGATGSLQVSQVAAGHKNDLVLELFGTAETLLFEQERPEVLWVGRSEESMTLSRDSNVLGTEAARLSIVPAGHPMGYQDAFNAFVRDSYAAFVGRPADGTPTLEDGLRAAIVTRAVIESARTRSWIDIEPCSGEGFASPMTMKTPGSTLTLFAG